MKNTVPGAGSPWWKFGHVWLVIAGPVAVVIAAFFTLFLALRWPDPVVTDDYYRQGAEINKTLEAGRGSLVPAVQARNHAATGAMPVRQTTPRP
jgi:hypothetical protein